MNDREKRIAELKAEIKTLIDLEIVRMKMRHEELMYRTIPMLIGAFIFGTLAAWLNWKWHL